MALLAFGLLAGGCVSTSAPFKVAAHQGGPFLGQVTRDYAIRDSFLGVEAKSTLLANASRLAEVTEDEKAIDYDATKAAWEAVRPAYLGYTNADRTLDATAVVGGPTARDIMQGVSSRLDAALAAEAKRRGNWQFFGLIPGS
jgi:hypothetical protein